jgi:hypothetical protein
MSEWFKLATQGSVVRRALMYAVIVGAVLISINHGNAMVRGEVDRTRVLQMGLTTMVPYIVSTLSSVGAMRKMRREQGRE